MKKILKILKIIFIIICIIVIVLIAAVAIFLKSKLGKINYEKVTREDIEINEGVEDKLKDYTNIVLLGTDSRQDTFDGGLSDCIMIFSINNKTNDVKIVSVYRDTFLKIDDYGLTKVNHAYAFGRSPLALKTLNKNIDLDITQYVTINFESVKKIVDAVGGVTISISNAEASKIPGLYGAGTYNLTGEQALAYGRIRKIDNDYVRTERMRNVVIKIFEKVKKLSFTEINKLLDELLPTVYTNISQREILSYASKITQYEVINDFGWPYEVRAYISDEWYAAPVTLEENVKKLHQELFLDEEYEVSDTVKEISNEIINKTGYNK